jgi:hypothetical protein
MSLMEFMREFPDDEACLQHLWRERFAPDGERTMCQRCDGIRVFKRYETAQKRPAWFCRACGFRIHPLKETIFERSSTSLQLWFYAIYLITSTRCGISAKQLERELGVTYKTAWRMFNKIRNQVMTQDETPLTGEVEADETFVGGKIRQSERRKRDAMGWDRKKWSADKKVIVFGAVERKGRIRATILPNSGGPALHSSVTSFVVPGSILFTDEYPGYSTLERAYRHRRIRHRDRIYVDGDVHTQTIEGFFGLFKNGVRGVYHSVSRKWLQGYINEYAWRYNRRDSATPMFRELLNEAVTRTVS